MRRLAPLPLLVALACHTHGPVPRAPTEPPVPASEAPPGRALYEGGWRAPAPGVLALSPDGRRVVVVAHAPTRDDLALLVLEEGAIRRTLPLPADLGEDAAPVSIAHHPREPRVALGVSPDTVLVADVARGEIVARVRGAGPHDLAWSPDGATLWAAGEQLVRVGGSAVPLPEEAGPFWRVAASVGGAAVVATDAGLLFVDAAGAIVARHELPVWTHDLAWDGEGFRSVHLEAVPNEDVVRLIVRRWTPAGEPRGEPLERRLPGFPSSVFVDDAGRWAVSSTRDTRLWDLTREEPVAVFGEAQVYGAAAFATDAPVLVANTARAALLRVRLDAPSAGSVPGHADAIAQVAWLDADTVTTLAEDGLRLWSVESGRQRAVFPFAHRDLMPTALAPTTDGRRVVFFRPGWSAEEEEGEDGAGWSGGLIWDRESGEPTPLPGVQVGEPRWRAGDRRVVTVLRGDHVDFYDLEKERVVRRLARGTFFEGEVEALDYDWADDGASLVLALSGEAPALVSVDATSGEELGRAAGRFEHVRVNGERVAASGEGGLTLFAHPALGEGERVALDGAVVDLAFRGGTVAWIDDVGRVGVRAGGALHRWPLPLPCTALDLSPDGRQLVVGTEAGTAWLVDVSALE